LWIVVGLGNPEKKYSRTRHNLGFMLVQRLADKHNVKLKKRKYLSKAAQVELERNPVLLVKPWTYMNRSGVAIKKLLQYSGVRADRMIVVYDDLDIPLGEMRIRRSGGPGTHNGMASIVREIGCTEFPRVRLGIGPLPPGTDATDFVLGEFTGKERQIVEECLDRTEESVTYILSHDIEKAMTKFNRKGHDVMDVLKKSG
jgi:PTH1 family peptidyl-tRNA hydrolase